MDSNNLNMNSPEVSPVDPPQAPTLEDQLAAVTAERDQLAKEKAEAEDRLLRTVEPEQDIAAIAESIHVCGVES